MGDDKQVFPVMPGEAGIAHSWSSNDDEVAPGGRRSGVALLAWSAHPAVMHTITAYERRDALSIDDLTRLQSALVREVERYRVAIQGYSPTKMRDHGAPFLAKLEGRVEEVSGILTSRSADQA